MVDGVKQIGKWQMGKKAESPVPQTGTAAVAIAERVHNSGERLLQALAVERKLKRKRGDIGRSEMRAVQRAVDACVEDYLKAMREYLQFFLDAIREEGPGRGSC